MTIKNFPFLSPEEFVTACHHLDRQYRQATLGPLRRRWRLDVCTALALPRNHMVLSPWTDGEGSGWDTYVQITRPLEAEEDPTGLALNLNTFSLEEEQAMDQEMVDAEEADEESLQRMGSSGTERLLDVGYVTYEIHLHPTYRVPCLWFRLHGLPAEEDALDVETVFRRLVPDQFKGGLRKTAGGMGGISMDHHPLTGVPSFFVHPCLIQDAMAGFAADGCEEESYLTIWTGLSGGCVGLWVPKEMAMKAMDTKAG